MVTVGGSGCSRPGPRRALAVRGRGRVGGRVKSMRASGAARKCGWTPRGLARGSRVAATSNLLDTFRGQTRNQARQTAEID
eukprot:1915546-Rhodomonas_salina.1